jgi:hypothetical protein
MKEFKISDVMERILDYSRKSSKSLKELKKVVFSKEIFITMHDENVMFKIKKGELIKGDFYGHGTGY